MNKQSDKISQGWQVALPTMCAALGAVASATVGFMGVDATLPEAQAAVTGFYKPAPPADTIDLNREVTMVVKIPTTSENSDKGQPGYTVTISRLQTDPINTTDGYRKAAGLKAEDARKLKKLESYNGVTDSDGKVEFNNLKPGAYLVSAQPPSSGGRKTQEDVILAPIIGEDGQWDYHFTVVAKFEVEPPVPPITPPPVVPPTITTTTTVPAPPIPNTEVPPNNPPRKPFNSLPVTGAQITGIVAVALGMVAAGFIVLLANRKKRIDE
ncbi:prealbumin-like fold domain-containing protein [Corynebacterium diphtheriae]|uniref:prealbumin-like fold domain-containing protein n=1 Tax=Corynebacterium diphtheriae TaxID=1717 RepID=UPI000EB2F1A9|nr:prealbumin-like fold domain-containing protein [Corynebacterium diphtheriae]RKW97239.1 cell surface protein [Corynebacterium diphtheriae]